MKSLKTVRDEELATTQDPVVVEAAEETNDDDGTGHALVALNHMASITDDLYTAIGDEGIELSPEDIDGILNSYDILSTLHEKHAKSYDMPSLSYDDEDVEAAVKEDVRLQAEEFTLAESLAWQTMVKSLGISGFKMMPPEKFASSWKPANCEVYHMFGIPMRAGKFADTFFAITDNDAKPYTLVNHEGTASYAELGQALAAIKKLTKAGGFQEAVSEEEHAIVEEVEPVKADVVAEEKFVPTPWDIIEALSNEDDIRRLARIKDAPIIGMAEEAIIESILTEAKLEDANLAKAIEDFRIGLKEASNPSHGYAVRYTVFSKKGDGPIVHKEISFPTLEKMEKWMDTAEDKVPYFHEIQAASYPSKKEGVELDEAPMIDMVGKACPKCGKGKYKDNAPDGYVRCDDCGDKAKRFQPDIPISKTRGGKRILSALKKEDAELDEAKSNPENEKHNAVLTWDGAKGQMDPYRLEVIGQDGDVIARILDKVLPASKGNKYTDDIGFKTRAEREAASKALIKYFKTVKEEAAHEIELGDMNEAFDETKFKRLAATGLVPAEDVMGVVRAMKVLEAGKVLTTPQKDLISSTFATLIGLVTGDMSVFTKVSSAVKKATAE